MIHLPMTLTIIRRSGYAILVTLSAQMAARPGELGADNV